MYYQAKPAAAPLPHGWEAKYDPTNRKWFYINHITKTTQWNDPRIQLQQSPQMPQSRVNQQAYIPQKPAPTTTSFIEADPQKVDQLIKDYGVDKELTQSLLRTHLNNSLAVEKKLTEMGYKKKKPVTSSPAAKFADADPAKVTILVDSYGVAESLAKSMLRTHSNNMETSISSLKDMGYTKKADKPIEADNQMVSWLKRDYPSAALGTIRAQLVASNNSIGEARRALVALGYRKKGNEQKKSSKQAAKQPKVSPAKVPAPKKPTASPAMSTEQAKRELKKKFPTLDDVTIDLCLKVAQNDVAMATKILEAKAKKDTAAVSSVPSTSKSSQVEKDDDEKEEARDYAPKVFDDSSSSSSPVKAPSPIKIASFISSTSATMRPFSTTTTTRPSTNITTRPATATETPTRAKNYYTSVRKTNRKPQKKNTGKYKSALRSEPVGPNSDLCHGPDPSLLLKTFSQRSGPNKANYKGAQKHNRCGVDANNRAGPANLSMGPSSQMIQV